MYVTSAPVIPGGIPGGPRMPGGGIPGGGPPRAIMGGIPGGGIPGGGRLNGACPGPIITGRSYNMYNIVTTAQTEHRHNLHVFTAHLDHVLPVVPWLAWMVLPPLELDQSVLQYIIKTNTNYM